MKRLKRVKAFYDKYERYLIPGALVFGFVTDVLTFRFINFTAAMILLAGHILFVGVNITVINFYEVKRITGKFFSYWRILAPLFLQYSFGNLFSAFLIFYSHSGSFSASWPFIGVVIFLMIGNEVFRKYNVRPSIQISVYFFAIFSYLNLLFPNLLKDLGDWIFIGSGLVSLTAVVLFIHFLSSYVPQVKERKKTLSFSVGSIFLVMNLFYFFNLIPPIPLSIQDIGIYHDIRRVDGSYEVLTEECDGYLKCLFFYERRHISSERGRLYLYSAVFAPEDMKLNVSHEWQKFNEENNRWETAGNIPFSVVGGRDTGYRWYTYYMVTPGFWRVNVKTEKGQTIGRKNFYVFEEDNIIKTKKKI